MLAFTTVLPDSDAAPGMAPVEVTLDNMGGTGDCSVELTHDGYTLAVRNVDGVPVREGYTFMGWAPTLDDPTYAVYPTDGLYQVTYYQDKGGVPGSLTLYAIWAKGTGTVDDPLRCADDGTTPSCLYGYFTAFDGMHIASGTEVVIYGSYSEHSIVVVEINSESHPELITDQFTAVIDTEGIVGFVTIGTISLITHIGPNIAFEVIEFEDLPELVFESDPMRDGTVTYIA